MAATYRRQPAGDPIRRRPTVYVCKIVNWPSVRFVSGKVAECRRADYEFFVRREEEASSYHYRHH